ncbi:unnamed protein product [Cyclocybe aegerita]|uniref:Uncharacterized protein n=1 Tax=Cyclocybe aegerita TaxID=1973307 RepID=A0A8S0X2F9_CYCAE|nr:unnamed protein product [Cyclocybe aegerita]
MMFLFVSSSKTLSSSIVLPRLPSIRQTIEGARSFSTPSYIFSSYHHHLGWGPRKVHALHTQRQPSSLVLKLPLRSSPKISFKFLCAMDQPQFTLPALMTGYLAIYSAVDVELAQPSQPQAPPMPAPALGQPSTQPKKKKKPKISPAAKKASEDAHFELVMEAAQTVTSILESHGLFCAVFGSLAAKLYGNSRCPKDVDLLVSQDVPVTFPWTSTPIERDLTAAELKELVLRTNSRNFFLKMPRDPTAEYRILWYRKHYLGAECKVDILVPGTMYLPFLYPDCVRWISGVPLAPFPVVFLHKVQGWDDHRLAEDAYNKGKQHKDAGDLRRMLALKQFAEEVRKEIKFTPGFMPYFGEEFMKLTRERVKAHCQAFPDRARDWEALGFEVL